MKKQSARYDRRKKPARRVPKPLKWIGTAAAIALVVYGVSQMSTVAYNDADIRVVDFSSLTAREKRTALEAANRARCTCGCGMTLAQCVSTDMTCPFRDQNIQGIRTMVREADEP